MNFSAGSSENLNLSGGSIDVSGSLTVGPNAEFHIPSDSVVTILNDASLTNDGTITNHGTVTNEGTITNSGTINGAGTLIGNGTLNGSKVLPAVTPPTAANDLSFTGTEYELISAGSTNGGTMQYSLSPAIPQKFPPAPMPEPTLCIIRWWGIPFMQMWKHNL